MPQIHFKPIDSSNWLDAIKLEVKPDQSGFVATNAKSLVQAAYQKDLDCEPFGVYDGETMVGFLMSVTNEESRQEQTIWIMRFMIGADHQGKGYGKAAMQEFIDDTRTQTDYQHIKLSYVPSNTLAQKLYASVGFLEEGLKEEWGEVVARLDL